jgi:hypothetical protein
MEMRSARNNSRPLFPKEKKGIILNESEMVSEIEEES